MNALHLPSTFTLARYRFTIEALEPIHLPRYAGSTLRGGLGSVLRRLVCYRPGTQCPECDLGNDCVYSYLFRTAPPDDAEALSALSAVPRPFVVQAPLDTPATLDPGERLGFDVVLVGRALAYAPYFVLAYQQLGNAGLGRGRGRFKLTRVMAVGLDEEAMVFEAADGSVRPTDLEVRAAALEAAAERMGADRVDVAFLTPTRLKHRGELAWHGPPFHVLVRRLLDRVSSLSTFHCGERWEIDFKGWIERARDVEAVDVATSWADWERYSGRQDRRVKMGGLVGPIAYVGDVAPFCALLALGTLVHVGKGTVMGNGRFAVKGLDGGLQT
jgi:hypothetical protein